MKLHAALILTTLLACSASAFAQTVRIHVKNGAGVQDDLYVTVSDQNQPGQAVFNGRINGGTSEDVQITADGSGKGSVAWRVVTTRTPPVACVQITVHL
jgi:hypothetical protein